VVEEETGLMELELVVVVLMVLVAVVELCPIHPDLEQ
jgi:hypothetical protein